ncbi:MAG: hypothetical protein AAF658_20565 [Myxococcota bacterium]
MGAHELSRLHSKSWLAALALAVTLTVSVAPGDALARTLEPGKPIVSGEFGPSFLFDSRLGGSSAYLMVGANLEYPFDKSLSAVGNVAFGLAGSQQLKLRGGARYHITGLDLPVAPYGEGHLVLGQLFDILGTDLGFYGIRAGVGADYFLTGELIAGLKLGYEITRSSGPNPVWFTQLELIATASFVF